MDVIMEAADLYLTDAPTGFEDINWDRMAARVAFDYSGAEVERALPLALGELRPGLPEPNVAARLTSWTHRWPAGSKTPPWCYCRVRDGRRRSRKSASKLVDPKTGLRWQATCTS